MRLSLLAIAAALTISCATAPAKVADAAPGRVTITADKDGGYGVYPKHHKEYPDGILANNFLACVRYIGNEYACICAIWNMAEHYSIADVEKQSDGGAAAFVNFLDQCQKKHPAPTATSSAPTFKPVSDGWTTTQADGSEDERACQQVGLRTAKACAYGYIENGGSKDENSVEYRYGVQACDTAGNIAYSGCKRNLLETYKGKSQGGACKDVALYMLDSISTACYRTLDKFNVEDPAVNSAFKSCAGTWAPKGTEKFAKWCEGVEKKRNAQKNTGTNL